MKITIELSPEHTQFIAKYAALTGYTQEEFAGMFLAEYLKSLTDTSSAFESALPETLGAMYFKDLESAERVQAWMIERVSERFHLNSIKTRISTNDDGTFDVRMHVPCTWNESGWSTIA